MLNLFKPPPVQLYEHLPSLTMADNHLLAQILSDDNLDAALSWLKQQCKEQDHSDVWDYARAWTQHKVDLQQTVMAGLFQFQTVREVEIETDGQREYRELRCAQDRVLIRAISQVLQPIFSEHIAPECVHLAGHGGINQAVEATHQQLKTQPKAFVMKSDVKGYYAHIEHFIVQRQFCTLLPNESELQRLIWQFMQRTVERGGLYKDIECGIPLGVSLSPLLGALYLSPLDALFTGQDKQFYRRYMDDWVIFCKSRWQLRNTVKQVYAVLQALHVEIAPDKTYIGKAEKGFDFLGKRILPIGVLPSQAALSRMQKNTVRLYEQGASKQRIVQYWVRWLGWAGLMPIQISATPFVDHVGDEGTAGPALYFCQTFAFPYNCSSGGTTTNLVLFDYDEHWDASSPLYAVLPDNNPSGATYPASFYSFAKSTHALSIRPTVTCDTPNNGSPTEQIHRTIVTLSDGEKCNITVTPKAKSGTYAHIFYSGELSRSGNVYFLKKGNICGAPFSDCPVLTITTAGTGSGTVTNNSPHSDGRFPINANVTLTVTPAVGSVFAGWSGDAECANSFNIGEADKTCIATFDSSSSTSPIPASLIDFNQPAVIYSKEIIVTE